MKYHPIEDPKYFSNRDYIGKHWNRKFIRTIQAILNSTKGKVGKGKKFFEKAFGKDEEEFNKLYNEYPLLKKLSLISEINSYNIDNFVFEIKEISQF